MPLARSAGTWTVGNRRTGIQLWFNTFLLTTGLIYSHHPRPGVSGNHSKVRKSSMAAPQDVPIPEIFVLWHPRCALGEKLARRILEWLRPGNGLGPEVFYRSLPAPGAPPNGLPLPLPGEARPTSNANARARQKVSNLQVVLPLIEENMVADQAWRYWLGELALDRARTCHHAGCARHDRLQHAGSASENELSAAKRPAFAGGTIHWPDRPSRRWFVRS